MATLVVAPTLLGRHRGTRQEGGCRSIRPVLARSAGAGHRLFGLAGVDVAHRVVVSSDQSNLPVDAQASVAPFGVISLGSDGPRLCIAGECNELWDVFVVWLPSSARGQREPSSA